MDKSRLQELLYNALIWILEENADFFFCENIDEYEWFEIAIGTTKEEINELEIFLDEKETQETEQEEEQ